MRFVVKKVALGRFAKWKVHDRDGLRAAVLVVLSVGFCCQAYGLLMSLVKEHVWCLQNE